MAVRFHPRTYKLPQVATNASLALDEYCRERTRDHQESHAFAFASSAFLCGPPARWSLAAASWRGGGQRSRRHLAALGRHQGRDGARVLRVAPEELRRARRRSAGARRAAAPRRSSRFLRGGISDQRAARASTCSTAAGSIPFIELEKDGLLTRYDPPPDILAHIPAQLNGMAIFDPAHEWFGAALSGFGIITNERARQAAGLPRGPHVGRPDRPATGRLDLRLRSARLGQRADDLRDHPAGLRLGQRLGGADGDERQHAHFLSLRRRRRRSRSGMGDAAYGVAIDSYGNAQAALLRHGQRQLRPARGPDRDHARQHRHPEKSAAPGDGAAFRRVRALARPGQLLWMLPKGAPGGATRDTHQSHERPARALRRARRRHADHDQSVQDALRLRLLQRARLETAHDPERRSSPRG